MSIVLLAILAVMWVAFLLPVIATRQPRGSGWARRRLGRTDGAGWRPTPDPTPRGGARSGSSARAGGLARTGGGPRRPRSGARTAGRSVLRRRRVLLGLTLAAVASIRVRYVLGGRWWVAEAVTGALLSAYLIALVVQGYRRRHPAPPALPAPPARRALPPPPTRRAAVAMPPPAAPPAEPSDRRGPRQRRRRQGEGPLWGAPLLEGQGPPSPE